MPTLNVNKIGDYNSIGLSFNVWVKGDKWNTDEAVTIRLNITYEKRASHRNYYNGNPGSSADDVFYYNGGEADIEYEGKYKSWGDLKEIEGNEFRYRYGEDGYE